MDDFLLSAEKIGIPFAILVWTAIGIWRLVKDVFPSVVEKWQEAKLDQQEHRQALEEERQRVNQLERLAAMGSQSFTEEQLTQMAAETHEQLREANQFIREVVMVKMDSCLVQLEGIYRQLQQVTAIPDTLQQVIYQIRDLQTKISILTTFISEVYEKDNKKNLETAGGPASRQVQKDI